MHMGYDKSKYDPLPKMTIVDPHTGLSWEVSIVDVDFVYVTLQYRSLYDFQPHSCKMRLAKTDDMAKSYLQAKRFVSILGIHRNKDLMNYWPKERSSLYYEYNMYPDRPESPYSNRDGTGVGLLNLMAGIGGAVSSAYTLMDVVNTITSCKPKEKNETCGPWCILNNGLRCVLNRCHCNVKSCCFCLPK